MKETPENGQNVHGFRVRTPLCHIVPFHAPMGVNPVLGVALPFLGPSPRAHPELPEDEADEEDAVEGRASACAFGAMALVTLWRHNCSTSLISRELR